MEDCDFKTIKLDNPELTGGMSLFEALYKRKSERNFDKTKFLSLKQLSQLLWCCYGNNRPDNYKVVPSGTHMNPLIIYVFMKKGIFKNCPESSELQPIKEGDFRAQTGFKEFVKDAALNLVIVSDFKTPFPYKNFNFTEQMRL